MDKNHNEIMTYAEKNGVTKVIVKFIDEEVFNLMKKFFEGE